MNKERIGSLFFLILGIYGLIGALHFSLGTWEQPGSAAFPMAISILLIVVGTVLFIAAKGTEEDKIDISQETFRKMEKPFKIALVSVFFIFALEDLGYLPTVWFYLFGLFWWVSRYKLWRALIFAGIAAPATWYFFGEILGLPLPRGPLGF
jgi:hypothetical protein